MKKIFLNGQTIKLRIFKYIVNHYILSILNLFMCLLVDLQLKLMYLQILKYLMADFFYFIPIHLDIFKKLNTS